MFLNIFAGSMAKSSEVVVVAAAVALAPPIALTPSQKTRIKIKTMVTRLETTLVPPPTIRGDAVAAILGTEATATEPQGLAPAVAASVSSG